MKFLFEGFQGLKTLQSDKLDKLISIAKDRGNRLNSMLLYNVVTAMPGDNEKEDTIYEM